jgi:hypothetical protein
MPPDSAVLRFGDRYAAAHTSGHSNRSELMNSRNFRQFRSLQALQLCNSAAVRYSSVQPGNGYPATVTAWRQR